MSDHAHAEEGEEELDEGGPTHARPLPKMQEAPAVLHSELLPASFFQVRHRIRLDKLPSGKSFATVNDVPASKLLPGHKDYDPDFPMVGKFGDNHALLARAVEQLVNDPQHATLKARLAGVLSDKRGQPLDWHGNLDSFFTHLQSQAAYGELNGYNPNNPFHQFLNLINHAASEAHDASRQPDRPPGTQRGANTPGSQRPGERTGPQTGRPPGFPGGSPYGAMPYGPYGFPPHFDPSMPYGVPHPSWLGPEAGPYLFPGMHPSHFSPQAPHVGPTFEPAMFGHGPYHSFPYAPVMPAGHGAPVFPGGHAGPLLGAAHPGWAPQYAWFAPHLAHVPPEHWQQMGLHGFMPGQAPSEHPYGSTHEDAFRPSDPFRTPPVAEPRTPHATELMQVLLHKDIFTSKEARATLGRELDALKQEGRLPGLNPFGFSDKQLSGTFEEALSRRKANLLDVVRTLAHPAMPADVAEHLHAALLRGVLHHAGTDPRRANYVASEFNQLALEKHVRFQEGGLKNAYDAVHGGRINAVRDHIMEGGDGFGNEYRNAIHSIRPTSAAIPGASHHEVHTRLISLARRMYR